MIMRVTETELAWLAGFLDGEGTIGISRCNAKKWPHECLALNKRGRQEEEPDRPDLMLVKEA